MTAVAAKHIHCVNGILSGIAAGNLEVCFPLEPHRHEELHSRKSEAYDMETSPDPIETFTNDRLSLPSAIEQSRRDARRHSTRWFRSMLSGMKKPGAGGGAPGFDSD